MLIAAPCLAHPSHRLACETALSLLRACDFLAWGLSGVGGATPMYSATEARAVVSTRRISKDIHTGKHTWDGRVPRPETRKGKQM